MRNFAVIPLVLALGCEDDEVPSQYASANLEQALATPEPELEGSRRDASGQLGGRLDGTDLELEVGTSEGPLTVTVHAPGQPILTAYLGEPVLMSVLEVSPPDEHSVLIRNELGEVLYLIETITPSLLTTEAFSSNFVDVGNDLGPTAAYLSEMRLFSAIVTTDTGTIEAFPGEPQEILVDGISYRFVLTAAWERTLDPGSALQCSIRTPVLAYDVSRVEPGTASVTPLERAASYPIEQGTCGLPADAAR